MNPNNTPNPNNPQDPRSNQGGQQAQQAPNPNTQLYGENGPNVQPPASAPPPEPEQKSVFSRLEDSVPKILWIPLFPILVIVGLYLWVQSWNPIPKRWRMSGLFGVIQIVVGALIAAYALNAFIFQSYAVVGDSMLPTLSNNDRLIVNKAGKTWSNLFGDGYLPKRGDIIVFNDPQQSNRQLVKRVIGLPGDRVVISKGVVTVFNDENPEGFNPDEAYANSLTQDVNYSLQETVTENNLFVAGDNRIGGASFDSRNDLGLVPIDNVVGDLVLRLLPLSDSRFY